MDKAATKIADKYELSGVFKEYELKYIKDNVLVLEEDEIGDEEFFEIGGDILQNGSPLTNELCRSKQNRIIASLNRIHDTIPLIKLDKTPHEWAMEAFIADRDNGGYHSKSDSNRGVSYLAGLIEGYENGNAKMFTLEDMRRAVQQGILIHYQVATETSNDIKGVEATAIINKAEEYIIRCLTKYARVELEITNQGDKGAYYCSSMADWVPKVDKDGYVNRNKIYLK